MTAVPSEGIDRLLHGLNFIFLSNNLPVDAAGLRDQLTELLALHVCYPSTEEHDEIMDAKIDIMEMLPYLYLSELVYWQLCGADWGENMAGSYECILQILEEEWTPIYQELYSEASPLRRHVT